jgi:hypothetical protein
MCYKMRIIALVSYLDARHTRWAGAALTRRFSPPFRCLMANDPIRPPRRHRGEPARDRESLIEPAARLGITPERVLAELALIAFADLARIAEWGPGWFRMKDSESLAKEDSAAISEVVVGGNGATRVKLFEKKAALALLVQHFRMYEQSNEQRPEGEARETEDPREFIVRRLAELAARAAVAGCDPQPAGRTGEDFSAPMGKLGTA